MKLCRKKKHFYPENETRCKECKKESKKAYNLSHPEKVKKWKKNDYYRRRDYNMKKAREWAINNKERRRLYMKEYKRKWKAENIEDFRNKQWNYEKKKLSSDPAFKIKKNLRIRISKALKEQPKTGSVIKSLGCDVDFLRKYLEDKFQPGMNWTNYGIHGWHIDHIKPLSLFNLTDPEELKQACHYTNLQPLWAKDNLKKSNLWN